MKNKYCWAFCKTAVSYTKTKSADKTRNVKKIGASFWMKIKIENA